jgi:hypothetical protein
LWVVCVIWKSVDVFRLDSLYEEVLVCNTLRRSLDGHVAVFDLVKTLNRTVGLVDFFIQVNMLLVFDSFSIPLFSVGSPC